MTPNEDRMMPTRSQLLEFGDVERCLECGGELEMASPVGPLYCPDCDPELAPDEAEDVEAKDAS